MAELTRSLESSASQHSSSVDTLRAALRHQENRTRSLQEELLRTQETLKERKEEFDSYKVGLKACYKTECNKPSSSGPSAECTEVSSL